MQITRTLIVLSAGGLIATSLAACSNGSVEPVVCPGVSPPAIVVEVRDAITSAPAAAGAVGVIKDGSYTDTLRVTHFTGAPASDQTAVGLSGGYGRPGTYDVTLTKPGYQAWSQTGVNVPSGPCGPLTARLEAFLTPL
jgi:hypothetical protein